MDTTSVYKYTIQQTENTHFFLKKSQMEPSVQLITWKAINPEQTNKQQNKN